MVHLLARANEALLEAQRLRQEGRVLRLEAAIRASELGQTITRAHTSVNHATGADGATAPSNDPHQVVVS